MPTYYDVVAPREAQAVLDYTIDGGESLLIYGTEDFGQILTWINLADLSLELVPTCRESLNECLDWFSTNRERVEVALTILRDARHKIHDSRSASLFKPSPAYRMLIERVCDGKTVLSSPYYPSHSPSLSLRKFFLEEDQ
jgi:hypothetical protein